MSKILKLALSYMRFYKSQIISLLVGVILSAALITGIGSLIYSGHRADLETARKENGDWHYQIRVSDKQLQSISNKSQKGDYALEKYGVITVKKILDKPYNLTICSADKNYMDMMGRTLISGTYPVKENDMAMDYQTINNLGISDSIGTEFRIDGAEYTLCGILSEVAEDSSGDMKVFVSNKVSLDNNIYLIYVKFDENNRVYQQLESFTKSYNIALKRVARNNEVTEFVGGESPSVIFKTFVDAFTNSNAGIIYLIANLNESIGLVDKTIFAALGLFGVFILYSIYSITMEKRRSEYGILHVIGLENKHLFGVMLSELLIVAVVGYPIGCIAGNCIAKLIYSNAAYLFSAQSEGTDFYIAYSAIMYGAIFYGIFIILICVRLIARMNKYSDSQVMQGSDRLKHSSRKIYALRRRRLVDVMTNRFMFGNKRTFIGIIISLSLGGILFLGTSYVAESTRANMNHSFQTDEGIGSDMSVYIDSDNPSYFIPDKSLAQIHRIKGVSQVDEMSYILGEIPLDDGRLVWTSFFPELCSNAAEKCDPRIMDNYNGIVRQTGKDSYRMKVNVYGYTDSMMKDLDDYIVDGNIDVQELKRNNSIILKTLTDGQGNTNGINVSVGDKIKLKVPKSMSKTELLRFNGDESEYIEKEFTVAAIVKRPIAGNDYYIGDSGSDTVDIIMPNDKLKENYNVSGYNSISINLENKSDNNKIVKQICKATTGLNRCMVKDYTDEIHRKNAQLNQKVYFFYGIAAILLVISLLHIVNSMKHNVISRRHEFGIIRAMGITDKGFRIMMVKEGVCYGLCTCISLLAMYLIVHRILQYIMQHVFLYIIVESNIMLPQCLFMIAVTILICVFTLFIAGNSILKDEIIEEI